MKTKGHLQTSDRPEVERLWRNRVREAVKRGATTPFFLFSAQEVFERAKMLEKLDFGLPASCLLSLKTHPLPNLLASWIRQGRTVEVVSEFETRAALAHGCPVDRLLVNGPAKHRWLPGIPLDGLQVNFDSINELRALLPLAKKRQWRVGIRIRTPQEIDPENQGCPSQFGMTADELKQALKLLRKQGLTPYCAHTHLRTNLPDPSFWTRALAYVHEACAEVGWQPSVIDAGGGLPAFHTRSRSGGLLSASYDSELASYASHMKAALRPFRNCQQLWLEHGRHVSAGSGVLVIRVLDIKTHDQGRSAICDGGRTLQALVSMWESHDLLPLRQTPGPSEPVTIHGPTCMPFDQLGRVQLPHGLKTGDLLLWMEAGAYHLPWETRFSHGLCEVWWTEEDQMFLARPAESFLEYWGRWVPRINLVGDFVTPCREIHLDAKPT